MATVEITEATEEPGVFRFTVSVQEAGSRTVHRVTLSRRDHEELAADGESPEAFVSHCFEWLLEREPKKSILPRFDIRDIARYFPRFPDEIRRGPRAG